MKRRQVSRCLLCESLFNESVFPETTLPISLVTSFLLFSFISVDIPPSFLFHFALSFCFDSPHVSPCTSISKTNENSLTSAAFPSCLFRKCVGFFINLLGHDNFTTSSICVKTHQCRKKKCRKIMLERISSFQSSGSFTSPEAEPATPRTSLIVKMQIMATPGLQVIHCGTSRYLLMHIIVICSVTLYLSR